MSDDVDNTAEPAAGDAESVARAWTTHAWLSACDVGSDASTEVGAYTICDACDRDAGPTHSDLARARSAAFLAELARRGIEDGETAPADVLAMDAAPGDFNGWPDALSIEHDEDCPIRLLLDKGEALATARAREEVLVALVLRAAREIPDRLARHALLADLLADHPHALDGLSAAEVERLRGRDG